MHKFGACKVAFNYMLHFPINLSFYMPTQFKVLIESRLKCITVKKMLFKVLKKSYEILKISSIY